MNELSKLPSQFASEQFVEYITEDQISLMVESLAHTINNTYKDQELILVGILKGSTTFMCDLIKKISNVKIYVDFVKLSAVGRSKEEEGTIIIEKDISTNINGKSVLIVEEIIDTGRALNFLNNRLLQSTPSKIEIVTLFDKPYSRAVPIKADYIGKQITDSFVIGYGLDLDQYGRNLSSIYHLKYPN